MRMGPSHTKSGRKMAATAASATCTRLHACCRAPRPPAATGFSVAAWPSLHKLAWQHSTSPHSSSAVLQPNLLTSLFPASHRKHKGVTGRTRASPHGSGVAKLTAVAETSGTGAANLGAAWQVIRASLANGPVGALECSRCASKEDKDCARSAQLDTWRGGPAAAAVARATVGCGKTNCGGLKQRGGREKVFCHGNRCLFAHGMLKWVICVPVGAALPGRLWTCGPFVGFRSSDAFRRIIMTIVIHGAKSRLIKHLIICRHWSTDNFVLFGACAQSSCQRANVSGVRVLGLGC